MAFNFLFKYIYNDSLWAFKNFWMQVQDFLKSKITIIQVIPHLFSHLSYLPRAIIQR
jgi:hypothetical protein